MSLLGVIVVFGVVVNDAPVLLERYILTTATTLLGLSPLPYERSEDVMFLVPFGVSIISEVVLSGVFILFVLPTLVMIAEGRSE